MQTLIISDIHGCYDELQALLDQSGIGDDDRIICIGDLLDKGPQPRAVLDYFMATPNASSIRGNHEQKHIDNITGKTAPRAAQLLTRWHLDENYGKAVAWMQGLPLYMDLPDALLVHGYYEPGIAPTEQREDVLLGFSSGEKHLKANYDQPWFMQYDGDKPIVVGHRDYTNLEKVMIYNERVYCIDTRCVYGGSLTGLLLPEWRLISVPARENHWQSVGAMHNLSDL
jgi:serine/threonine protein phosphatase 1